MIPDLSAKAENASRAMNARISSRAKPIRIALIKHCPSVLMAAANKGQILQRRLGARQGVGEREEL